MDEQTMVLIEKARTRADVEARKWVAEMCKEGAVESCVRKMLDARLEKIVASLMGFESRYSDWEVDHCNGRAGESAAGDWLRERSGQAVRKWLDEQAGNLPELPAKAIKSLRREYLEKKEDEICRLLLSRAVADARAEFLSFVPVENSPSAPGLSLPTEPGNPPPGGAGRGPES